MSSSPPHIGPSLRGPGTVDLVEVTITVISATTTGPLPHHRVLARAGDPAEEVGAGRGPGQAPAGRVVRQARRVARVGPLVGVGERGVLPRAEDVGPDAGRGVHACP